MEPNVRHVYSSSPPALGGGVEDDDEFGDFGGFSGANFTELDIPIGFCDTRPTEAWRLDHLGNGIAGLAGVSSGYPCNGDDVEVTKSYIGNIQASGLGFPQPRKTIHIGDWKQQMDPCRLPEGRNSRATEVNFSQAESWTCNGDVAHPKAVTKGHVHAPKRGCTIADLGEGQGPSHPEEEFVNLASPSNCGLSWGGRHIFDPEENSDLDKMEKDWAKGKNLGMNGLRSVGHMPMATVALSNGYGEGSEPEGDGHYPGMTLSQNTIKLSWEVPSTAKEEAEAEDRGKRERVELTAGRRKWEVSQVGSRETRAWDMESTCETRVSVGENIASFCPTDRVENLSDISSDDTRDLRMVQDKNSENSKGTCLSQAESVSQAAVVDFCAMLSRESSDVGQVVGAVCGGEGMTESLAGFPGSDSFADFSSAPLGAEPGPEWDAFGEQGGVQAAGDSWVAFGVEESAAASSKDSKASWLDVLNAASTSPSSESPWNCRRGSLSASLSSCLERLFQTSFPKVQTAEPQDMVPPLGALLQQPGEQQGTATPRAPWDVWQRLQDIHGALGLRHQWGGSRGNRVLLTSLGIDTRNAATSESSREAVKSISATEKIPCTAQTPSVSPEKSTSSTDSTQAKK
ncbi:aftiphilin-like [Brienomyrus brachyistius]|uniref:aftiphilin-like n=1 Tax=Brienomyrus brachyistius TaxID=42636 RepID=UPI0020B3CEAD|nr:aftiphilin-like [Brienomyrus brachyistius]